MLAAHWASWAHPRHAAEPRAPHETHEQRLQLIVRVVPGRDEGAVVLRRKFGQQFVPGRACVRFEVVRFVSDLGQPHGERYPPLICETGHVRGLCIGL